MIHPLASTINEAYESATLTDAHKDAILQVVAKLDSGELRVASPIAPGTVSIAGGSASSGGASPGPGGGESLVWQTNEWVKKAVLLYFRSQKLSLVHAGDLSFYDKIPVKRWTGHEGVRVVPHAVARYGSFVSRNAVLMPCYINIGAYVGEGTMVDTWATVGSCAQVGANVHVSGGVGLGGVLEPVQASPVIIEDDVFLGSRSIVVEGVHVKRGAVIGAGVSLTASTKIIDVTGPEPREMRGVVPENSVVIPGTQPKAFPAGTFGVACALIIGRRTASTDKKTSLNQVLRDFSVPV